MQKQHNYKLSVFIEFSLLPTFSHITCVKFQRQLLKHKKLSQYISGQNYSSSCDYYRHVNMCNYTALKSRFTCCHIVVVFLSPCESESGCVDCGFNKAAQHLPGLSHSFKSSHWSFFFPLWKCY